jgi:hypothetical protein
MGITANTAEHRRLEEYRQHTSNWKKWGPYLSERAWGTVREDYSEDGDAWDFFPHELARSRVYRWNEDGLAGISDRISAWPWPCGTAGTPSSRSGCSV